MLNKECFAASLDRVKSYKTVGWNTYIRSLPLGVSKLSADITIVGNVTADPEIKFLPSGAAVTKFSIADNRKFKVNGEDREETSFFDVEVFGKLAEPLAETVLKGTRVILKGSLEQQRWQDKETSANRSKVVVKAFEVGISCFAIGTWERRERDDATSYSAPAAAPAASADEPW
jgi:single-strand DNA-binding protein